MVRLAFAVFPLSFALAGAALADTPSTAPKTQAPHVAATGHDRPNPEEERMTKALNLLEAKGYGTFTDFRADGKNYAATVTADGKTMTVIVDPDADQVTHQS